MMRILYIEDDKAISDIFTKRFEKEGFKVAVCDNGEDALISTLDFKPDLVITGILMPKVSGFDVIDVLKHTKETEHIPIMVLSALKRKEDIDRAQKLGAIDYMVMSQVTISDVLSRIKKFFDSKVSTDKTIRATNPPLLTDVSNSWKYPNPKIVNDKLIRADAGDLYSYADSITEIFNANGIEISVGKANIAARFTQFVCDIDKGGLPKDLSELGDAISRELGVGSVFMKRSDDVASAIIIEVPNLQSASVNLSDYINGDFKKRYFASKSTIYLGVSSSGEAEELEFSDTSCLLIAGQTGSGKSHFFDNIVSNILLKNSPDEAKLVLIDPKYVQFHQFKDIPHLLTPVINDPDSSKQAIEWVLEEIDRRIHFLSQNSVRTSDSFNSLTAEEYLPEIYILCDEVSDLMMVDGEFYEEAFIRIASNGKRVGIHIAIATSRPSKDVFTDKIVDNFKTKLAFALASDTDSRHILERIGAEELYGQGDAIFRESDNSTHIRIQTPYISDKCVENLEEFVSQQQTVDYWDLTVHNQFPCTESDKSLFNHAKKYILNEKKASTMLLQKKFGVSFRKAAEIIELLEMQGVVGPLTGNAPRSINKEN